MEAKQEILHTIVRAQAMELGLNPTEAEECAAAYIVFWMAGGQALKQGNEAYVRKSAAFFASNFRRKEARRKRREVPFSNENLDLTQATTPLAQDLLAEELHAIIEKAIKQLTERQRDVFVRHYLYGYTVPELAAALQKTQGSVEQILHRARNRLRGTLERMGYDEAALREYLVPIS